MIANLNPPASVVATHAKELFTAPSDQGYAIHAKINRDGQITVTNDRNGYSKTYQVK